MIEEIQPNQLDHTRASRTEQLMLALRIALAICSVLLVSYFVYMFVVGEESSLTLLAGAMLCVFLVLLVYLMSSPDPLRAQYTERSLVIASDMMEDLREGLTPQSAEAICRRLLPETRAITVAVTDAQHVLACRGEYAQRFPPGSPIHTPATHYAIEHGVAQTFTRSMVITDEYGDQIEIPAGIVAPLRVRDVSVGTLKFYFRRAHDVDRTQYALVSGYAELISTQLAIHELERQDQLTARAEVRALQAQINPHFLFNTLNTISALTRTDPMRARSLLREFAIFYRSTLDNSGSIIPVSREVAQTKRYLTFEQARFGEDRIQTVFDVAEDAEEVQIPAFVVQPIVENAVRHAMRDEGPLHIRVAITADGDDALDITVTDDGVGMDAKTAAQLFGPEAYLLETSSLQDNPLSSQESMSSNAKDTSGEKPVASAGENVEVSAENSQSSSTSQAAGTTSNSSTGAGVAMRNIFDRIHRFYGPRSFVRAASTPNVGTTVSLHLDLRGSIFA